METRPAVEKRKEPRPRRPFRDLAAAAALSAGVASSSEVRDVSAQSPEPIRSVEENPLQYYYELATGTDSGRDMVLHHMDQWIGDREWGEKIAFELAKRIPYVLVKYSERIAQEPWGIQVLKRAVDEEVDKMQYLSDGFLFELNKHFVAQVMNYTSQKKPESVVRFYLDNSVGLGSRYRNIYLVKAFSYAAVENPDFFFEQYFYRQDLAEYLGERKLKELFQLAVKNALIQDPRILVHNLRMPEIQKALSRQELAELVERALEQCPGKVYQELEYDSYESSRRASSSPLHDFFKDEPSANRLVDAVVEDDPGLVLHSSNVFLKYRDRQWYQQAERKAALLLAERYTHRFFEDFAFFIARSQKPYCREVFVKAVARDPNEAVQFFNMDYVDPLPSDIWDLYPEAFRLLFWDQPEIALRSLATMPSSKPWHRSEWFFDMRRLIVVRIAERKPDTLVDEESYFAEDMGYAELVISCLAPEDFLKAIRFVADRSAIYPAQTQELIRLLKKYNAFQFNRALDLLKNEKPVKEATAEYKKMSEALQTMATILRRAEYDFEQERRTVTSSTFFRKPHERITSSEIPIRDRDQWREFFLQLNEARQAKMIRTSKPFSEKPLISIPLPAFEHIFFSETFQNDVLRKRAGRMTWINAFSLVHAIHRELERRRRLPQEDEILDAANSILEAIGRVSKRELFGPNTQLVAFTDEEKRLSFDPAFLISRLHTLHAGTRKHILVQMKGPGEKDEITGEPKHKLHILQTIQESEGPTTILYSGHGREPTLALNSGKQPPVYITAEELGNALVSRGNLGTVTLILESCYSYNFRERLEHYLRKNGANMNNFVVITAANIDRVAYGSFDDLPPLLLAMHIASTRGQPILLESFFRAESDVDVYMLEDPSLTIGLPDRVMELSKAPGQQVPPTG